MAIDVTNRETIRDEIATFLETALVGSGKPVQAVYNYQAGKFENLSPVVMVLSAGDDFNRKTLGERIAGNIYIEIWIYVLYGSGDWGEDDAEDSIDEVKKEVLDTLFDNQFTASRQIFIDGRSTVTRVNLGGQTYLWEAVPLQVQVFDG